MTPQKWIESAKQADSQLENIWFITEGAAHLAAALEEIAKRDAEIARLRAEAGRVVVPEIPTWDDCEAKVIRGEKRTALEKFVQDHDWQKNDTQFRDGLEAVFDELRTHSVPSSRVLKDGEVGVPAEEWVVSIELLEAAHASKIEIDEDNTCDMSGIMKAMRKWDALRTPGHGVGREVWCVMAYLDWMPAHPWASLALYIGATAWLGMTLTIAANTLAILTRKAREVEG